MVIEKINAAYLRCGFLGLFGIWILALPLFGVTTTVDNFLTSQTTLVVNDPPGDEVDMDVISGAGIIESERESALFRGDATAIFNGSTVDFDVTLADFTDLEFSYNDATDSGLGLDLGVDDSMDLIFSGAPPPGFYGNLFLFDGPDYFSSPSYAFVNNVALGGTTVNIPFNSLFFSGPFSFSNPVESLIVQFRATSAGTLTVDEITLNSSIIPEPGLFPLLAGLLAFGWVLIWRKGGTVPFCHGSRPGWALRFRAPSTRPRPGRP